MGAYNDSVSIANSNLGRLITIRELLRLEREDPETMAGIENKPFYIGDWPGSIAGGRYRIDRSRPVLEWTSEEGWQRLRFWERASIIGGTQPMSMIVCRESFADRRIDISGDRPPTYPVPIVVVVQEPVPKLRGAALSVYRG